MVDAAISSARELFREIWDVEQHSPQPELALRLGRAADRLTNIATVLIYAALVAFVATTIYRALPSQLRESQDLLTNKLWFWVGITAIILTALRFGLVVTKTLKKWNVAAIAGSLLLFDKIAKECPPLFGFAGISPIEQIGTRLGGSHLAELMRGAIGL